MGTPTNLGSPSRSCQPGTGKSATKTNAVGSSGLAVKAKHTTARENGEARLVRGSGQTRKILPDLADVESETK